MAYGEQAESVRAEEQVEAVRASDMPHMRRQDRRREFRRLGELVVGLGAQDRAAGRQARWDHSWRAVRQLSGVEAAAAASERPADPDLRRILRPGERVVLPDEGGG